MEETIRSSTNSIRTARCHMEYVRQRGYYADVPYDTIIADFKEAYPRWFAAPTASVRGDFAKEAGAREI